MNEALKPIANWLSNTKGLPVENIQEDAECAEYSGYNFEVGDLKIKFRNAKITPKKVGQFVTLWKRNPLGQTEPFNIKDDFCFYIIATQKDNKTGFFFFPKQALRELGILTSSHHEGKRGFRVYPIWDIPSNKQAERTKIWQNDYFIDLTADMDENIERFNALLDKSIDDM